MDNVIAQLRAAAEQTDPPRPFDLDESLRRARARNQRRRAMQAVAGVTVTAVIALGAAFVWPDPPDSTPRPAGPVATPGTPTDELSLLDTPREPEDALPPTVEQQAGDSLGLSSFRRITEWDGVRYWAGVNNDGHVCLAMVVPVDEVNTQSEGEPMWGVGCGGGFELSSSVGGVQARLLPDGYEPSAEDRREWTFVTPNLAVAKGTNLR